MPCSGNNSDPDEIDEDALRDLLKVDPNKVKKAAKRRKKQRRKKETD